ncbi:MAG: tetrathionate reductase family octaheme c-type cytochrome [Pelovirga sp.]
MYVRLSSRLLFFLCLILIWTGTALAVDHSKFVRGPFENGPEVTETCLYCHESAAEDIMKTSHWTWSLSQVVDGKRVERGKINAINNFCVSVAANEPRCTSCHIGYGWEDQNFDFSDQTKVDCLVCHDTTGSYKKTPTGAGKPDPKVNLERVAQNVGKTSRESCGSCHFFGGGGDAVKHGDLDSSIANPSRDIDVHMAAEGMDYTCTDCHTTENHNISGQAMVVSPTGENHIGCVDCHGDNVHSRETLNTHSNHIACQTCHIPTFAKEVATKTSWDWSTAGQDLPAEKDENGRPVYDKRKGHFTWGKNIVPTYAWYNGSAGVYEHGDKIDPNEVTKLNYPLGSKNDGKAKIYPFKVHTAQQIYDTANMYLITPKVWGPKGDDEAYWQTFDWDVAAAAGMKASGLEYSGEYDFTETIMYWRINHMVSPKEQALGCADCHGKNTRLDWEQLGYAGDPIYDPSLTRDVR